MPQQQTSHRRIDWGSGAMCDTSDTHSHELTIELRNVVREYRVGGQSVRALDEISLRLNRWAVRVGRRAVGGG